MNCNGDLEEQVLKFVLYVKAQVKLNNAHFAMVQEKRLLKSKIVLNLVPAFPVLVMV